MIHAISPDALKKALESREYTQIHGALTRFDRLTEIDARVSFFPSLTVETLEGIDRVDDSLAKLMIKLMYRRQQFDPAFPDEQRREEVLDLNLRHGSHYASFEHALLVKISEIPLLEAEDLLLALRMRGIIGEHEKIAAQWLVFYLLDSEQELVRSKVVHSLCWMNGRDDLGPVVEFVLPALTEEEKMELAEW
ncbi:hypothetical protein ACIBBE_42325 [Streptomyces sp. NPDC051644]|uniref:hypothetical protein n=1 Tax=Streptomyces sp. NPDC051644 TaxID=3365666 RepID=UPI0037B4050C